MIKKPIIKFVGYILLFLGLSMFATSLWPLYYGENDFYIFIRSGLITSITALILLFLSREATNSEINLRDGFYVVTIAWIFMGIFCSIPYYLSDSFSSFTDAFFESMSGITTTGATILGDIEALPHGLLFWRSFTQFIGGMGIIVFSIAIWFNYIFFEMEPGNESKMRISSYTIFKIIQNADNRHV